MCACVDKIDHRLSKKVHRTKSSAADISSSSSQNNVYIGATSSSWNSEDHSVGSVHLQREYLKGTLIIFLM